MKKVLVCDWLDKYAGSERVIKVINEIVRPDKVYTMVNIMSDDDLELIGIKQFRIEQTFMRIFGSKFRYALPLFPLAVRRLNKKVPPNALIISSSHSMIKGVISKGGLHICYMQARNMKYIWEESPRYMTGMRKACRVFNKYLRRCDKQSAQVPDYLIANSRYVADWIYDKYGRKSTVIYPPVEVDKFRPRSKKEDYYIFVGRLELYKRVDLIIRAFNDLQKKLVIVGDGSEIENLRSIAKGNVEFVGFQGSEAVSDYLAKAKAFVIANEEDFGIAPVEAQACGTPVIAYGKAGVLETVVDGKTGVFFHEQTVEGLKEAVSRFQGMENSFDTKAIRKHAEKFTVKIFEDKFSQFVEDKMEDLQHNK